jgi:putative transposase
MKRKKYSVEQIVAAVKQHELGTPVADIARKPGIAEQADIARKPGIAEQTFYRWKKQYGGLEASEVRELKQLREENAKLKKLVADLSLDKLILQAIASTKW